MSGPKPAILLLALVLVALVALFAVSIGARAEDDRPVSTAPLKRRWLGAVRRVSVKEVKGDPCRRPLRPGERCAFEVAGSRWTLMRALPVRTQDAVTVVLSPAGQRRRVPVDLRPARPGQVKRVDLQVDRKGGQVEITCRAPALPTPGTCVVDVGLGSG